MNQLALAVAMGLGLSLSLLAGCTALPVTDSLTLQPVLRINHSAEQTAASWYQLGQYHQQRGQFDLARAAYAESAALNPAPHKKPNPVSAIKPVTTAAKKTVKAARAKPETESGPAQPYMELVQIGPHEYRLRYQQQPALHVARTLTERPTAAKAALRAPVDEPLRAPTHAPVRDTADTADRSAGLEIVNGSGAPGIAKKTSQLLLKYGINVTRISNERPYRQQRTEIQYQRGYKKEALALNRTLGGKALVVRSNGDADVHAGSDLRLVLGKDATRTHAGVGRALAANWSTD